MVITLSYVKEDATANAHMESPTVVKSSSCMPCAKRKVRCDQLQPCSHCKRRKTDKCVYPLTKSTASKAHSDGELVKMQQDRIYELEQFILRTGGDPNDVHQRPTFSPQHQVLPRTPRTSSNLDQKQDNSGISCSSELTSYKTRAAYLVEHDKQIRYIDTYVRRSRKPNFRSLIYNCPDLCGTAGAKQERLMERQRHPSRRGVLVRNDKLNLALATILRS